MEWDDFKLKRSEAIQKMQDLLDETEPLGLNVAFVFALGTPVVFYTMLKTVVFLLFGATITSLVLLFRILITPFLVIYFTLDMTLISFWYLGQIAKRTSEDMK